MTPAIPPAIRRFVFERAAGICEYCLIHHDDAYHSHHVDHVVSRKHGGLTKVENLALACFRCNVSKGSDIGSLLEPPRRFVPLFDPRRQRWSDHFFLHEIIIEPISDTGAVTVNLLDLNSVIRCSARQTLASFGRYPSIEALARIREA